MHFEPVSALRLSVPLALRRLGDLVRRIGAHQRLVYGFFFILPLVATICLVRFTHHLRADQLARQARAAAMSLLHQPKRFRRVEDLPVAPLLRVEDLPVAPPSPVRPLRPDELTPDLIRAADDVLWNHKSTLGTEVPIEVGGKTYFARFELHFHEVGGPVRPWGYHTGITVYSTD